MWWAPWELLRCRGGWEAGEGVWGDGSDGCCWGGYVGEAPARPPTGLWLAELACGGAGYEGEVEAAGLDPP